MTWHCPGWRPSAGLVCWAISHGTWCFSDTHQILHSHSSLESWHMSVFDGIACRPCGTSMSINLKKHLHLHDLLLGRRTCMFAGKGNGGPPGAWGLGLGALVLEGPLLVHLSACQPARQASQQAALALHRRKEHRKPTRCRPHWRVSFVLDKHVTFQRIRRGQGTRASPPI